MINNSSQNVILKAMIEGKFIKKSFNKLVKIFDRNLGILSRNIVFKNTKVNPKKIFFMTFQGDYTCNPKYITEELIRENVDCEIVWGMRISQINNSFNVPRQIKMVDRYTYEYYQELASSRIWVLNSVEAFKNPIKKKKNQILIETWHGSLGIKRFDKDANHGKAWVKAAEYCGKITDYCISNSKFEDKVFKDTFWKNSEILDLGHPRNDMLFENGECLGRHKKEIIQRLGLDANTHYVLYGPTFRDSHNFDCYRIDYNKLIETLEKKFGGVWKVLVRFHPTVRNFSKGIIRDSLNVIDVTDYPDIQEIMLISDVAITDYSSWIYDFILTRKPGFIFATDISQYNHERGFYYKLESTPFSIATDNEQLMSNILQFDNIYYEKKVEEFLKNKGCVECGEASKKIVCIIKKLLEDK